MQIGVGGNVIFIKTHKYDSYLTSKVLEYRLQISAFYKLLFDKCFHLSFIRGCCGQLDKVLYSKLKGCKFKCHTGLGCLGTLAILCVKPTLPATFG